MRLLIAVALIVFIGILDDSLARNLTLRNTQLIVQKARRIALLSVVRPFNATSHNSTGSVGSDLGPFDELVEECARNGGPNASVDAETGVNVAVAQLMIGIDVNGGFETAGAQMREQENLDPVFQYLCQRKNAIENFTVSLVDAIKPCFDAETRDDIDAIANLSNSFNEYLCRENGTKISEFFRSPECSAVNQRVWNRCGTNKFDSGNQNSTQVNEIDVEYPGCTEMSAARNCIQTEMKSCPNPNDAEFILGLYDFVFDKLC